MLHPSLETPQAPSTREELIRFLQSQPENERSVPLWVHPQVAHMLMRQIGHPHVISHAISVGDLANPPSHLGGNGGPQVDVPRLPQESPQPLPRLDYGDGTLPPPLVVNPPSSTPVAQPTLPPPSLVRPTSVAPVQPTAQVIRAQPLPNRTPPPVPVRPHFGGIPAMTGGFAGGGGNQGVGGSFGNPAYQAGSLLAQLVPEGRHG